MGTSLFTPSSQKIVRLFAQTLSAPGIFSFTPIPTGYKFLILDISGPATSSQSVIFRINNDNTAMYGQQTTYSAAAAVGSSSTVSATEGTLVITYPSAADAGLHAVFANSSTKHKTFNCIGGGQANTSSVTGIIATNTEITRLDVYINVSTNFATGSFATLYGVL